IVAVKLKGLLPASRADRIGARTLDRNDDLSLFQFGLQNADFGKVQRKLDHWRHRSIPLQKRVWSTSACHNFNRAPRPQHLGAFPAIPREPERKVGQLSAWMEEAQNSKIPELRAFVRGIENDRLVVEAALSHEWSNGQVEGQVHRLKLLKRQM